MIDPALIEEAGYQKDRFCRFEPHAQPYYKAFYDDHGNKLYTIILKHWMTELNSVSAWAQFNTSSEDPEKPCFNVDMISPESIELVEAFFKQLFEKMECVPRKTD